MSTNDQPEFAIAGSNENAEPAEQQAPVFVRVSVQGDSVRDVPAIEGGKVEDYLNAAEVRTNQRQVLMLDGVVVSSDTLIDPGTTGATLVVTDKNANG